MSLTRDQILSHIVELLQDMARDWDFQSPMTAETRLFADLNFESLDLVVLGTAVQERFGQKFPFAQFFAELGERQIKDLTVGEWVDFIHQHMQVSAVGAKEGA